MLMYFQKTLPKTRGLTP